MAYERSWTPDEYAAVITELEAIGFFVSHPGVMTRAGGPLPLVVDLLPHDDTSPGWVRMSVPNGALVDLVKATVRAEAAEAEAALLRQALNQIDQWWTVPHAQDAGTADLDTIQPKEMALRRAVESARTIAAKAVTSTNAGQSLLDHLTVLEEQNRLLSIIDAGCPVHLSYHARTAPRSQCGTCWSMWQARQALDKLKGENKE